MNNNVNNRICDAIDIIVNDKVSQAKFDKTIQATIISLTDASKGEYKVKYLNNIFYAYDNSGNDTLYDENTSVYILVPENDFSKVKTILGKATTDENIHPVISESNTYEYITKNIINVDGNTEFGIVSYKNETIVIYQEDKGSNITIDKDELKYAEQNKFDYFVLSCAIRTKLQKNLQIKGDYGIRVYLKADKKKNKDTEEEVKDISLSFELNTDMMTGNPYLLYAPITLLSRFNVSDYKNFKITKIELFSKNFNKVIENEKLNPETNIFIDNITLQGANKITTDNLNSNYLYISTPRGLYLDDNKSEINLKAIFYSKGKIVEPKKYLNLLFFWFKKNPLIKVDSDKYCKIDGLLNEGWECLNTFNKDSNTWSAASDIQNIKPSDILSNLQVYKCVALYNNIAYSAERIIFNNNSQYIINMSSDNGYIFYNDNGIPTLTCECKLRSGEDNNSYNHRWLSIDINNSIKTFTETSNNITINIADYPLKVDVDCAVSIDKDNETTFIGVGSVQLLNVEDNNIPYTLIINNSSQVFKYNTNGISPIHASKTNPNILPSDEEIKRYLSPLSFYLLDNKTGEKITELSEIKWILPKDDTTMLDFSDIKSDIKPEKLNDVVQYYYYDKGNELPFSIRNNYDVKRINNTIILEVKKDGQIYLTQTNLLFMKEGNNGTNGTEYVCLIMGKNSDGVNVSFTSFIPSMIGEILYFNDTPAKNKNLSTRISLPNDCGLFIQLYKNGNVITENDLDDCSIIWSILKQPYIKNEKNEFGKNNNEYIINIDGNTLKKNSYVDIYSNKTVPQSLITILKAEISFKEKGSTKDLKIYATLPISIVTVINAQKPLRLEKDSGFYYVMYESDGTAPNYNKSNFILNTKTFPIERYDYKWEVIGSQLRIKEIKNENGNSILKVEPNNYYYSEEFNNGIKCSILPKLKKEELQEEVSEDTRPVIASIIIPIHMYLNKYGHEAINNWDGNTVEIDKEGGIILSPLIGAGEKDEQNGFTGMIMGTSLLKDSDSKEIGLMGLHSGERSFFLNAKDGSATFGKNDAGLIKIDPSKNQAIIEGGQYQELTSTNKIGSGMLINLTEPSITYGNKKFTVNKYGELTCTDANINGQFSASAFYQDEQDKKDGKINKYEMTFSESKSLISMERGEIDKEDSNKIINKIVTEIKPGYFKVGSSLTDKNGEEIGNYLKYSNGNAYLKGNFLSSFSDEEKGKGSVTFNENGITMNYKTTEDEGGIIEKFSMTHRSFGFGLYQDKLIYDENEIDPIFGEEELPTEKVDDKEYKMISGISYTYDTGLSIVGKLTATSGTIGGWKINSKCISSASDNVVLYSDGRIYGRVMNKDDDAENSEDGFLSQENDFSKTNVNSWGLSTYKNMQNGKIYYREESIWGGWLWRNPKPKKDQLKYLTLIGKDKVKKGDKLCSVEIYALLEWKEASKISTDTKNQTVNINTKLPDYSINFELALAEDKKLVSKKISFVRPPSNNNDINAVSDKDVKYAELLFPYKVKGKKEGEVIKKTGTRISAKNIIALDYLLSTETNLKLKTRLTDSLAKGINEILTPPNRVTYEDNIHKENGLIIDKITETWNAKDGYPEFTYEYEVGIKDKGGNNEEVLYLKRLEKIITINSKDETTNEEKEETVVTHESYIIELKGF